MLYRLTLLTIAITTLFSFQSCKEDDPVSQATLPSNLIVEVEYDEIRQGKVLVTATADNANFYTFSFGSGQSDDFKESNDGTAEFIYSEEGTYTLTTRAHATQDEYIELNREVNIIFEQEEIDPDSGYSTPTSYNGYTMVWNDEFDGSNLSTDWNYEIGTGNNGWGNNELQFYREDNVTVSDGLLQIEAKNELFQGREYTSSRITTEDKQEFRYGRIDIRAKMPYGQGMWPALWMLGANFSSAGWPFCGEIDIMEMVGGTVQGGGDNVTHGTVHWDNAGQYASYGDSKTMPNDLSSAFHVYSIIWDENEIAWYINDQRYNTIDITPADLSEFHQPFFFILNVAVGGNWPGSPDGTTEFPQSMYVDYIRVFQDS